MLPDCFGCVVLRLVLLRRPFGCTFLLGALWRAGPQLARKRVGPCGSGGLRSEW